MLDTNVSLPDPMVRLRGLDRLVGTVLIGNPSLQFRINLSRSTLKVDRMPTLTTVEQLAESTTAELDQLAYSRRRVKGSPGSDMTKPKLKKVEETRPDDSGTKGAGKGAKATEKGKCIFRRMDAEKDDLASSAMINMMIDGDVGPAARLSI